MHKVPELVPLKTIAKQREMILQKIRKEKERLERNRQKRAEWKQRMRKSLEKTVAEMKSMEASSLQDMIKRANKSTSLYAIRNARSVKRIKDANLRRHRISDEKRHRNRLLDILKRKLALVEYEKEAKERQSFPLADYTEGETKTKIVFGPKSRTIKGKLKRLYESYRQSKKRESMAAASANMFKLTYRKPRSKLKKYRRTGSRLKSWDGRTLEEGSETEVQKKRGKRIKRPRKTKRSTIGEQVIVTDENTQRQQQKSRKKKRKVGKEKDSEDQLQQEEQQKQTGGKKRKGKVGKAKVNEDQQQQEEQQKQQGGKKRKGKVGKQKNEDEQGEQQQQKGSKKKRSIEETADNEQKRATSDLALASAAARSLINLKVQFQNQKQLQKRYLELEERKRLESEMKQKKSAEQEALIQKQKELQELLQRRESLRLQYSKEYADKAAAQLKQQEMAMEKHEREQYRRHSEMQKQQEKEQEEEKQRRRDQFLAVQGTIEEHFSNQLLIDEINPIRLSRQEKERKEKELEAIRQHEEYEMRKSVNSLYREAEKRREEDELLRKELQTYAQNLREQRMAKEALLLAERRAELNKEKFRLILAGHELEQAKLQALEAQRALEKQMRLTDAEEQRRKQAELNYNKAVAWTDNAMQDARRSIRKQLLAEQEAEKMARISKAAVKLAWSAGKTLQDYQTCYDLPEAADEDTDEFCECFWSRLRRKHACACENSAGGDRCVSRNWCN